MSTDRIVTTNTKIVQMCGLSFADMNEWERGFVESIERVTDDGKDCSKLSDKQRDIIDRIWAKHFA